MKIVIKKGKKITKHQSTGTISESKNAGVTYKIKTFLLIVLIIFSADIYAAKNSNTITLNAQQIKQMKVNSMIDLLNQIPSIRASTVKIEFNGFDTREILVLLDGRAINDPTVSWRGVNWSSILVTNIAKLEIIKGPTGGRYGNFSNGGVVKITTKQTDHDLQGNLHAAIGSANYKNLDFTARKRIGDYGINFASKWSGRDGFRDHSTRSNYKIALRLKSHRTDIVPVLLAFDYNKQDRQSPGPVHRLTPTAISEKENIGISILLPFENLRLETHFNQFKSYYSNPASGFIRELQDQQLKQKIFSSPTLAGIGQFDLGINGVLQEISGLNLTKRNETSGSLYLGKAITFANFLDSSYPLKVKLDIKGNYYSKFANVVNKGVRLSLPLENINLTFSAADFNNIPSVTRRYYSSTNVVGNPNLKMETGTNYNFTMALKATSALDISSSLFYNQATNLIKFTREGTAPGTFENLGSSTTKGLQADIKYRLNAAMQASLSYTRMQAIDGRTGNFITYSPQHEINLNLKYKPFESWLIASNTTYRSTRYYNSSNTRRVEGRNLRTNIRVDHSFSKQTSLYLRIVNLFDAKFHGMAGHPVDPLSFYFGIRHSY